MKRIQRAEVISRADYEKKRDSFRKTVMAQKDDRRIHLGPHLTFLFENHDTMLYQVQEMMRAEQMDDEMAIRHEIETYNELIGEKGEVGCTLLVEIDDKEKRAELLSQWLDVPGKLYLQTQTGEKIYAQFDERQVGDTRLSSVQYLKFKVGDAVPVAIGCDSDRLKLSANLKPNQSAALAKDLIG